MEVDGTYVDRGGDPGVDEHGEPIPGIPMIVYRVEVTTALKGADRSADTLPVAMVDLGGHGIGYLDHRHR